MYEYFGEETTVTVWLLLICILILGYFLFYSFLQSTHVNDLIANTLEGFVSDVQFDEIESMIVVLEQQKQKLLRKKLKRHIKRLDFNSKIAIIDKVRQVADKAKSGKESMDKLRSLYYDFEDTFDISTDQLTNSNISTDTSTPEDLKSEEDPHKDAFAENKQTEDEFKEEVNDPIDAPTMTSDTTEAEENANTELPENEKPENQKLTESTPPGEKPKSVSDLY